MSKSRYRTDHDTTYFGLNVHRVTSFNISPIITVTYLVTSMRVEFLRQAVYIRFYIDHRDVMQPGDQPVDRELPTRLCLTKPNQTTSTSGTCHTLPR